MTDEAQFRAREWLKACEESSFLDHLHSSRPSVTLDDEQDDPVVHLDWTFWAIDASVKGKKDLVAITCSASIKQTTFWDGYCSRQNLHSYSEYFDSTSDVPDEVRVLLEEMLIDDVGTDPFKLFHELRWLKDGFREAAISLLDAAEDALLEKLRRQIKDTSAVEREALRDKVRSWFTKGYDTNRIVSGVIEASRVLPGRTLAEYLTALDLLEDDACALTIATDRPALLKSLSPERRIVAEAFFRHQPPEAP